MNKVILMGRLTKEPELRYTSSNTAVCNFTLAVNRKFKQEGQPEADFFNMVAWTTTAEFINKYFTKGSQVVIVGRVQNRNWEDNDGKKHYSTDIIVEETYFADSKKNNNNTNNNLDIPPQENEDDDELPFN